MKVGDKIKINGLNYEEVCILLAGHEFHVAREDDDVYAIVDEVIE